MPRRFVNIKSLIITSLLALIALVGCFNLALAQTGSGSFNFNNDTGLIMTGNTAGYTTGSDMMTVDELIGNIILIALGLLGIIFLILLMYGGFTWMTAHGNEEKVKKANGIIMSSLLGLIITLAAYGVSYFLIKAFWWPEA